MSDKLTHLSLFSGIGGLDLAAEWAGIQTVGQCEWAEYPAKVLEKHWPNVPRWKDIRTLTGDSFYERTGRRTVDIISGGFPCQPFSVAGKQRGKEDDRYLWPEMVRVIKELRPTWVVGENVAGIVRMALTDILSELEACGYRTRTFLIPACAVGARHRRYRVAIVAHSDSGGQLYRQNEIKPAKGRKQTQRELEQCCEILADTKSQPERGLSIGEEKKNPRFVGGGENMGNAYDTRLQKTERAKQQTTGTSGTGKNVQHSDSTGCKEQHVSTKPDKERFTGRGCDAGDVCDTTIERLSDRASEPLGRQRTQEQEPERSDSNVSDSDNRSRDVRRDREFPTIEETERAGRNIRERAKEHEPGERRPTQSILGGVANGIPAGMDGDLEFLINDYWNEEPDIPRIATGIKHRVDRLKCLGNAVVPQQFHPIFRAISEVTEQTKGERRWG